ncbi:MAG: hypothetical protein ABI461_04865 [Polyangiaceae bacterium]
MSQSSDPPQNKPDEPIPLQPPARLRRVIELAYAVEGVVGARVWQSDGIIALGIRSAPNASPNDLLRRVEIAVASLREPEEKWEFGLLDEA